MHLGQHVCHRLLLHSWSSRLVLIHSYIGLSFSRRPSSNHILTSDVSMPSTPRNSPRLLPARTAHNNTSADLPSQMLGRSAIRITDQLISPKSLPKDPTASPRVGPNRKATQEAIPEFSLGSPACNPNGGTPRRSPSPHRNETGRNERRDSQAHKSIDSDRKRKRSPSPHKPSNVRRTG